MFLSLDGYKEKIEALYDEESVVFIRGGLACGKTTLAHYLATKYPEEYVNVPFADAGTEESWKKGTIEAVKTATKTDIADGDFRHALQLAKEKGLTLIYDEAHTLFRSPGLCTSLFKTNADYRPKLLLFSASGDGTRAEGGSVSTPPEITKKYVWTPPLSYDDGLKDQLQEAEVRLDADSIRFLMQFTGGRRGIFMTAMRWVQQKQSGAAWDLKKTIKMVRESYGTGS